MAAARLLMGSDTTLSSVRLFHAPHSSHRPAHVVVQAPQDWQT
jgi:hypothetical protein